MTLSPLPQPAARIRLLEIVGNAIVGGMETSVIQLLGRLPASQYSVTVLCPFEGRFAERLRAQGADVIIAAMPAEDPSWSSLQAACALVQTRCIDLIHAHLSNAHLLAGMAGRITGTPVVASIHGRRITQQDLEIQRLVGTHLHLVCRSTWLHGLALGIDRAQLHYIGNGVDVENFQPRERRAGLRAALGVPEGSRLVGLVGRLSPEKGPDVFLRAAAVLHEQFPDLHFLLLGDGPMRDELVVQARRAGLQKWVHFAAAVEEVAPLYAELDVLALCSHSEAMPLVLMEAMASGLPVVATHVGGVAEIVVPGVTGFLAAPGDYLQVAARIAELLRDTAQRERMGLAARAHAERSFSITTTAESLMQLFAALSGVKPVREASDARDLQMAVSGRS